MALFFDADWFDARLLSAASIAARWRNARGSNVANCIGLFTNERSATAEELSAFASVLGADLVEVTLRSGVSARAAEATPRRGSKAEARLRDREGIEARLERLSTRSA